MLPLSARRLAGKGRRFFSDRRVLVVLGCVFALFILFAVAGESKWTTFWLQVLTGNWSPEHPDTVDRWQFSFSILLAIAINWTPLLGAFGIVYGFLKPAIAEERRKLMNLAQAMKNRDAILLATIGAAFQQTPFNEEQRIGLIKLVRDAFQKGALEWDQKYLEMAVGSAEAERIKDVFNRPLELSPSSRSEKPHEPRK
jgi:hypothetical protein